jgi:hypothetical protein
MFGKAPGRSTSVNRCQRPAPSEEGTRDRGDAEQRVVGDHEEHGVEDHERDRAEAVAEPERRDGDPRDPREHREEAEERGQEGRHDGAHAHGHAERDGGGDRERGAHHHPQEALADVAGEAAVPDGVDSGAEHVAHAGEHARVDVQDRHDPGPDGDEQRERGEEGDEPRELANAVQERHAQGSASRVVRDLMSSPTGPSLAPLAAPHQGAPNLRGLARTLPTNTA